MAILGVIATFTIPKILSAQQNAADSAKVKEAMATISAAYQAYQQNNTVRASTNNRALTPYLNYVAIHDITFNSSIDETPNNTGSLDCGEGLLCFKLHNGSMLAMWQDESFNGTGPNNALMFVLDPDGAPSNRASIALPLYYKSRITTLGKCSGSPTSDYFSHTCTPTNDPSWFSL